MAKLTKTDIKRKTDEWAVIQKKLTSVECKRNKELDPHIRAHQEATDPIYDKYDPKITELRTQAAEIETEIVGWLEANGKPLTVEGDAAIASAISKPGPRVINAKSFFDRVKTKSNDFWECVSVQVGKAVKLLGDSEVEKISAKETKITGSVKLK